MCTQKSWRASISIGLWSATRMVASPDQKAMERHRAAFQ